MSKEKAMPRHIAIIMDGNGRWATARGKKRMSGHRAGMKALHNTVEAASDMGIEYLSVYAFSTENWSRSAEEVGGLMNLAVEYFIKEIKELNEKNVRLLVMGDKEGLPERVRKTVLDAEESTKDNTGLTLNIMLNYGGRDEIVRAVQEIIREGIDASQVSEEVLSDLLMTGGQPDPDILIRTSGEKRLSNYMLWQLSYAEFFFIDKLWPDFTGDDLQAVIDEYMGRDRRFGGRNED